LAQLRQNGAPTPRFDASIGSDSTTACTARTFDDVLDIGRLVTVFRGCQTIGVMGNHGDKKHPHYWECSRYAAIRSSIRPEQGAGV